MRGRVGGDLLAFPAGLGQGLLSLLGYSASKHGVKAAAIVHMLQMEKLRPEGDRGLSRVVLTELGLEPRPCLPAARSF